MNAVNPKEGQHPLRMIWRGAPDRMLTTLRDSYSITTAEELTSAIATGLNRPEGLPLAAWKLLLGHVRRKFGIRDARRYRRKPRGRYGNGVIDAGGPVKLRHPLDGKLVSLSPAEIISHVSSKTKLKGKSGK